MVTVICFLDDISAAFREAARVLQSDGCLVVGFIDRDSPIGRDYFKHRHENVFYREATFYTTEEVVHAMEAAGFKGFTFRQTIFGDLSLVRGDEDFRPGHGRGSFVVVRGEKT
jgi:ubiquinone/menaquinone biosynthesis C-methylase UbiE